MISVSSAVLGFVFGIVRLMDFNQLSAFRFEHSAALFVPPETDSDLWLKQAFAASSVIGLCSLTRIPWRHNVR